MHLILCKYIQTNCNRTRQVKAEREKMRSGSGHFSLELYS